MPKKANVLFFLHTSSLNNGAIRSLIDVIDSLQYSIKPIVLYPDRGESAIEYLQNKGINCYHVTYSTFAFHEREKRSTQFIEIVKIIIKTILFFFYIPKVVYIIKKEKINILYSNTSVIDAGVFIHNITKIPHIYHIREFGKEDHGLKCIYGDKYIYHCLNSSNALIYISDSIKTKYSKLVRPEIIQKVIYNDISDSFICPKEVFNVDQPLRVAIIGSIQKGKGQLEAIKAFSILKKRNIELHIAGLKKGKYFEDIQKYVSDNNIPNIYFDGFITDLNTYRSQMDIGLVCSSNEAFGRVTVEGMLSMMLMIGADAAGTSELIDDGRNGFLYPLGDSVALSQIISFIDSNRLLLQSIAQTAFTEARENFCSHKAAKIIYQLMNEIL
ncbi:glycosyltransferase [Bifidobacterium cebidarum]|uniref:Glycosyl transferase n=1 Tax=Bifidobacterium cebidarum TaxID=2650773 RepID=A0A6I1G971_9BIFI|nr:glycosyltransferase [Bifidobacterium cebidarum]KAB7788105.1 glycosyl transferase [Bifidobacterium cebidarum]